LDKTKGQHRNLELTRLPGQTQIGITQRYVHLIDAPLRVGVNAVGKTMPADGPQLTRDR